MRLSRFFCFLLLSLLNFSLGSLRVQASQAFSSLITARVDSTVIDETATIFFESFVGDLSIVSTDENPEEPIIKIGPNMWRHRIDVKKDMEFDGYSYRNYIIHNALFGECKICTSNLTFGQILYYKLAPKITVALSPYKSKVDRSTNNGIATIFFDSKIGDLSILQTDNTLNEPIIKINETLWFSYIDVNKDVKDGRTCYRSYLLKSPYSTSSVVKVEVLPNQVLYYTIVPSNELESQLIDYTTETERENRFSTIFFESCVGDLSIVSTEENTEEPIIKIGANLWCHRVDVKKDTEIDDLSYRNYLINNSTSVECFLTTPLLESGKNIYFKIFPKLTAILSPDKSKVNRATKSDMATIFFYSGIEDLNIICTDENPNDSIKKIDNKLWSTTIDVKKDIELDGFCYRNYLVKSPSSKDFFLSTEAISPNQVLYYTITSSNELEVQLIDYPYQSIGK